SSFRLAQYMFDRTIKYIVSNWLSLLWPLALFAGVGAAGWIVRRILFGRLRRLASKTGSPVCGVILDALHGPFLLWVLILAIHLATELSELPRGFTQWSAK